MNSLETLTNILQLPFPRSVSRGYAMSGNLLQSPVVFFEFLLQLSNHLSRFEIFLLKNGLDSLQLLSVGIVRQLQVLVDVICRRENRRLDDGRSKKKKVSQSPSLAVCSILILSLVLEIFACNCSTNDFAFCCNELWLSESGDTQLVLAFPNEFWSGVATST